MLNQESRGIGPIVSSFIGWVKTKEKTKGEGKGFNGDKCLPIQTGLLFRMVM